MHTVRCHLAREIYRFSALMWVVLLGLFSFFVFIGELDKVGAHTGMLDLFKLQALALPTQMYELLPIALLIGAILALAGLAQRQELVILRVSGVSGMRLLALLWVIALPAMLIAYVLSEVVMPRTEIQANDAALKTVGKRGGRMVSGYWFREVDQEGNERILNIGILGFDGSMATISLYEFDPGRELLRFSVAEYGRLAETDLVLLNVAETRLTLHAASDLSEGQIPDAAVVHSQVLAQRTLATTLTRERLLAQALTPERMAIPDLLDSIAYMNENHLLSDRQQVALWKKLAYPFLLPVMLTIAAPISFMQTRRGSVGNKVFIGILFGVGFYTLNQLALNMGMLSHWPPWVTALAPDMLALMLALGVLLLMENRHKVNRFVQNQGLWRSRIA